MSGGAGPAYQRRRLGRELRQRRDALGIERKDAARYIGVQPGTLSKIELGKQNIGIGALRALLAWYEIVGEPAEVLLWRGEVANRRGWWSSYGDIVPDWFRDYVGLECDAREIQAYESEYVPGLFQTEAYSAAVTRAAWPDAADADVEGKVDLRKTRQKLLDSDEAPVLRMVLNEAVLRRTVGGPTVMREQLERLLELGTRPNVSILVLPFAVGAHPAMLGAFSILRFADDPKDDLSFVYAEIEAGGLTPDRPIDLARYSLVHDQLCGMALGERESADLIAEVVEHL